MSHRYAKASRMVLLFGVTYLVAAWSAVILIDVFNVAGIRSSLAGRLELPMVWYHLFREGGASEMLQWTAFAATALVASQHAGWLASQPTDSSQVTREFRFLTLLSVAMLLMLIEDAGNPSHRVAEYVMSVLGDDSYLIEVSARLPVFILIGAVPVYAFVKYWPSVGFGRPGGGLLLAGFIAYGVATFFSVPANMLFDFYPRMGRLVTETLFGGRMLAIERTAAWQLRFGAEEFTGTLLMDFAVEESIELLGGVFFLAGVLTLSGHIVDRLTGDHRPDVSPTVAQTDHDERLP